MNLTSFQIGRCPVSLACSETAEVCIRGSRISVVFFYPVLHRSPCFPDVYFAALTWNFIDDTVLFSCPDIRLARTQTSAVSEHANETGHLPIWKEVKFIDRDPHWYTRRIKEAIHIRRQPNNINRDGGIEIPEAWIPTIRKHNSRSITKRTYEGTSNSRNNNEDRNAPMAANQHATNRDM